MNGSVKVVRAKIWEMGSDYMKNSSKKGINEYAMLLNFPKRYVLSGRTGLYLIAAEIKNRYHKNNIMIPEYCCSSMIEPFVKCGFRIFFYNSMNLEEVVVPREVDVVLVMDYFGFLNESTLFFVDKCKKLDKIVIVDATQTALSHSDTYIIADYVVASFRKWFDCICAIVYSRDGFATPEYHREKENYSLEWKKAAEEKENYIVHGVGDKSKIVSSFSDANQMLEKDFIGYGASTLEISKWENMDSASMRQKRRENAQFLIEEVNEISKQYEVELLFNKIGNEDCPLFVPVLIGHNKRNKVRSKMISSNIYCPVHWPIVNKFPYRQTLYHNQELSLICDQRYSEADIEYEVALLKKAIIE